MDALMCKQLEGDYHFGSAVLIDPRTGARHETFVGKGNRPSVTPGGRSRRGGCLCVRRATWFSCNPSQVISETID